jgi:hypothetical protein
MQRQMTKQIVFQIGDFTFQGGSGRNERSLSRQAIEGGGVGEGVGEGVRAGGVGDVLPI